MKGYIYPQAWLIIFVIGCAGGLLAQGLEHGSLTMGVLAWALADGVVLASGVVLVHRRMRRGGGKSPESRHFPR
jgi:hypothetical protein